MRTRRCSVLLSFSNANVTLQYLWKLSVGRIYVCSISVLAAMVLWCSGYHVCFTRRRSRVRSSSEPDAFYLRPNGPDQSCPACIPSELKLYYQVDTHCACASSFKCLLIEINVVLNAWQPSVCTRYLVF